MLDVPQAKLLEAQAMDSSSCSRQDLAMGRSKENGCGVDVWLKNAKIKNKAAGCKRNLFTIILRSGILRFTASSKTPFQLQMVPKLPKQINTLRYII